MRADEFGFFARQLVEQRAEAGLRRHFRLDGHGKRVGRRKARRREPARAAGRERHVVEEALQRFGFLPQAFEAVPFVPGANVHRLAEGFHLRRRHQAGVIVLMPGERQAVALDGVADEADRPVVIDPAERLQQGRQIVAGEIGHQPRQFVVGARLDQLRHRPLIADIVVEVLAPCRAALKHQRGIELVRAAIDPLPQACRRPARGTRLRAASRISGSPRPSRNCGTAARSAATALRG